MKRKLLMALMALMVMTGYTRCGPIEPPVYPNIVSLDPETTCQRGVWYSHSSSWCRSHAPDVTPTRGCWESADGEEVISNSDYWRIPDLDTTLEPGQCFKLPDCAGADPTYLGYFRTAGFNFVDPTWNVFRATGESRSAVIGARFIYLMDPPNAQQEAITEFLEDQEPEDALFLCARDDARPTGMVAGQPNPWRGWVTVGQTDEDRIANGEGANEGYAVIRYAIQIADVSGGFCGDSHIGVGEQCDDGNQVGGDGCNSMCLTEACGDDKLDVGEQCDDGNLINGDGCSSMCTAEPFFCGNGFLEPPEQCDDGARIDGDGCSATCTIETSICGNLVVEALEQCDDGNTFDGDGCSSSCLFENEPPPLPVCGNQVVEPGEQCDDGNLLNGDGCSSSCAIEPTSVCGNEIVEPGEQCDGGIDPPTACEYGQMSCQTCTTQCTHRFGDTSYCGDSFVDDQHEQCDDGNNIDGDGCSSTCVSEEVPSICGNGIIEGLEQCDDGNTVTETCPYGEGFCDVCSSACFILEGQTSLCGDGALDVLNGEQCDDGNLIDGDGCSSACLLPVNSTIEITLPMLAPDLNLVGGDRPRLTPDIDLTAAVQTNEPLSQLTASVVNCNPVDVSDCTPVVDVPGGVTDQWSVELPGFAAAPAGQAYSVELSVVDAGGLPGNASSQLNFEVYPSDAGLDVTCTRRYDIDTGELYLRFTLVDNGSLPPGYTLGDMFDARFWLYQRADATGWALDETDSVRTDFSLINPVEFRAADDGEYQLIFSGLLGFVEPIQTSIRIDTLGGPRDICTLQQ